MRSKRRSPNCNSHRKKSEKHRMPSCEERGALLRAMRNTAICFQLLTPELECAGDSNRIWTHRSATRGAMLRAPIIQFAGRQDGQTFLRCDCNLNFFGRAQNLRDRVAAARQLLPSKAMIAPRRNDAVAWRAHASRVLSLSSRQQLQPTNFSAHCLVWPEWWLEVFGETPNTTRQRRVLSISTASFRPSFDSGSRRAFLEFGFEVGVRGSESKVHCSKFSEKFDY